MWPTESDVSESFLPLLYEDELELTFDGEEEIVDSDEDYVDEDNSFTSPVVLFPPSASEELARSRSRSPIARAETEEDNGVRIVVLDDEGRPLVSDESDINMEVEVDLDYFLIPDAHETFEIVQGVTAEAPESREPARARGRPRVSRARTRGRGRARRPHRRARQTPWQKGDPLKEIYLSDDDVPEELRTLAAQVMAGRQTRAKRTVSLPRVSNNIDDDVFFDADDGRESLLESGDAAFEWRPMDDSFKGEGENFRPERTGSVFPVTNAYDAFRSYWDDSILQLIVEQTNDYATKITSAAFQAEWYPTNVDEILCLFSFWMMLGIIRMPTIKSCFSSHPLLKVEMFAKIFSFKRYCHLVKALHFAVSISSTNDEKKASLDRLHLLRPIITHLNTKFKDNYILSQNICIDESLTLWKGRLNIKQYIRTKAAKFGIKTYELCESATGYLWSFMVHTGKYSIHENDQHKSTSIVVRLITPLLNKGYRVFMDSWFNSPILARFLKRNGTDCIGTLRPTRQHVPPLLNLANLKQGQLFGRHSGDVCVMAWQDSKKKVTTISTCHGTATGLSTVPSAPPARPLQFKPQVVLDYNRYMGGVDLKDQVLEPYLLERKRCAKWYMKLFKRLLNCSILNSRIILESSTQLHQDHLDFRLRLVNSILDKHIAKIPLSRSLAKRANHSIPSPLRHRLHQHWPVPVDPKGCYVSRNRKSQERCYLCVREGRKEVKSSVQCETCKVALCIVGCFKAFHVK